VLVVDAQAVVRAFGSGGSVEHRPPPPDLLRALAAADWVKASRAEAGALDGAGLTCGLIVTDGARGSSLTQGGSTVRVEAFPAREVDPTGAGDCFLAGFVAGLLRGWNARRAARFGAFCGALTVEQHGVPRLTRDRLEAFPG
jgi:1D-myo-inositol 3-kinase